MTVTVPTDQRLLEGGLTVTMETLVEVFTDHWPGADTSRAASCPMCGHTYGLQAMECPSLAMARAILRRRRYEHPKAVPDWIRGALTAGAPKLPRSSRRHPPAEQADPDGLFDATPYARPRGMRGGH